MKKKANSRFTLWLPALILTAAACLTAFLLTRHTAAGSDLYTVALVPNSGMTILSENPVTVKRGGSASFRVELREGFYPDASSALRYEDGCLYVDSVRSSQSVHYAPAHPCTVAVSAEDATYAVLLTKSPVMSGETAEIRVNAPEHYTADKIRVNGEIYTVPVSGMLSFPVYENSEIDLLLTGETVSFSASAYPLGQVSQTDAREEYRYGETVTVTSRSDDEEVHFTGWSEGAPVKNGGIFLSADATLTYTLKGDTELYANFTDMHTYSVYIDSNGGTVETNLTITDCSIGTSVYLPADAGVLHRAGYALTGYNTNPDGSGKHYAPSSPVMVESGDTLLYAEWLPETPADAFSCHERDGYIVVTGLKQETGDTLIIPARIGGKKVKELESGAFRNNTSVKTVLIPIGITYIGENVFSGCKNLSMVYLPDTLETMSSNAFDDCPSFEHLRILSCIDTRVYEKSFDTALADKYMRLIHTPGKRIILVAGSSGSFGLDSSLLAEHYPDYTIVNFGASYLFGIQPVVPYVANNIHEGDIVIFAPEYYSAMYGCSFTREVSNWLYLESNYNMLDELNVQKVTRPTLGTYVKFLTERREILPGKQSAHGVFTRSAYNEYGDVASARSNKKIESATAPEKSLLGSACISFYTDAFTQIEEKGGTALFSFPPISTGVHTKGHYASDFRAFTDKVKKAFADAPVTVISDASDYLFDADQFYDNKYHMTTKGAVLRTKQLIADLDAYLSGEGR